MEKNQIENEIYQKLKNLIEEDKESWTIKPNFKQESNHFLNLVDENPKNTEDINLE